MIKLINDVDQYIIRYQFLFIIKNIYDHFNRTTRIVVLNNRWRYYILFFDDTLKNSHIIISARTSADYPMIYERNNDLESVYRHFKYVAIDHHYI